jgi:hypothetical protein
MEVIIVSFSTDLIIKNGLVPSTQFRRLKSNLTHILIQNECMKTTQTNAKPFNKKDEYRDKSSMKKRIKRKQLFRSLTLKVIKNYQSVK